MYLILLVMFMSGVLVGYNWKALQYCSKGWKSYTISQAPTKRRKRGSRKGD